MRPPSLKLKALSVVPTSRPPLVLIMMSAPSVVTVPAKAWAEMARARALAAKPAKCFIEDSPVGLGRTPERPGVLGRNPGGGACQRRGLEMKILLLGHFLLRFTICSAPKPCRSRRDTAASQ